MPALLGASQCRIYRDEGLAFPIAVLNPIETGKYRSKCDELEQMLGGKPRTIEVRQMHLHFKWAWELASHANVLDAVEEVLGPDLLVWSTELFSKHPQDAAVSIGWHRDRAYMGLQGSGVTTAWISLSNSTVENGCMRALPGPDHATRELNATEAVDVVLRAGEMSLHDPDILHGSGSNRSQEKRVGFAVRFMTPEVTAEQRSPVVIARGKCDHGRFLLVEPPGEMDDDRALVEMKRSASAHFESLLRNLDGHGGGKAWRPGN